ncbi:Kinetochore-associated protein KNL-2 [Glycine max]|nr:Kinetochore-associated protein KNL-2 [Glycine max]
MADSTPTATPSNDIVSSSFRRTVTLYDWWLVIAKNDFQGKRLAVAGVSSRKDEATRVFVSAAVIKRYDVFSLETADGICVIIRGFINEQRTLENGFSAEVFHHFLFGFPPDWERYALDCFKEEPTTDADLGSVVPDNAPASCPKILSDGVEKSIPTCLVSPEEASGDHEMSFPENECNVSGGKSRSARLHDIKVYQQKKPASGGSLKHPNNENSTSVALENCDVKGLKSPATPIQSQSSRQLSTSPGQVIKKSASKISRTLSPKTEGCYKKKRVTVETKVVMPKGKLNKSASALKNPREKDLSPLAKGSQQKISTFTPESLSFRKSRSGRLLLPPLEFWRNQIPIYNADHEITEIRDGASLISPCRGLAIKNVERDAGKELKCLIHGPGVIRFRHYV